jgi:hypothetical protein
MRNMPLPLREWLLLWDTHVATLILFRFRAFDAFIKLFGESLACGEFCDLYEHDLAMAYTGVNAKRTQKILRLFECVCLGRACVSCVHPAFGMFLLQPPADSIPETKHLWHAFSQLGCVGRDFDFNVLLCVVKTLAVTCRVPGSLSCIKQKILLMFVEKLKHQKRKSVWEDIVSNATRDICVWHNFCSVAECCDEEEKTSLIRILDRKSDDEYQRHWKRQLESAIPETIRNETPLLARHVLEHYNKTVAGNKRLFLDQNVQEAARCAVSFGKQYGLEWNCLKLYFKSLQFYNKNIDMRLLLRAAESALRRREAARLKKESVHELLREYVCV